MDDAELCRAVAVEVMGWRTMDGHDGRPLFYVGEPTLANEKTLALTGNDALRVIEKMRGEGFALSHLVFPDGTPGYEEVGSAHYAVFMRAESDPDNSPDAASNSFPATVFRAALAAKKSQHG